tara:strand:- start:363 stop:824 length:462 start_codon:yes stop_codon:yes gene_type:complete
MAQKIDKQALAPMPWRDFVIGFQVAADALDNPRLDEVPPIDPENPRSKQMHEAHVAIQKDPFLRVTISVRNHFGEDYAHMASFVYRFWALLHLLRKGHLSDWITVDDDRQFQSFHPAVLLAAAEARLSDKARFPPKRFIETVEQIITEESDGG